MKINSPPHSSKRIVWLWFVFLVLWNYFQFLRKNSFLLSHTWLLPTSFKIFSTPVRGSFQISVTILIRYRILVIFRVRSRYLPYSCSISKEQYSFTWNWLSCVLLRDYHPLKCSVPGDFELQVESYQAPHLFYISIKDSVCSVPGSIAFTDGIAFAFFSSAY